MAKSKKVISLLLVLAVLGTMLAFTFTSQKANAVFGDSITISGTQFMAGGQRIWINGANTPWDNWNDFGGSYDPAWWTSHFQTLHDNGVNATRVWITCNGDVGINIATDGTVTGATAQHWSDLDSFFSIAQSKGIYIMATLISFDHFKNTYQKYQSWRNMITNSAKIDTYVNTYVIPFVNRYKSNPYLWSIDLCNEADWIYEDAACGQISWDWIQTFFAKCAVAIHANSNILVTAGIAMPKYNGDTCEGTQGNKIKDSALYAKVADPMAKVDFYSTHFYDWMTPYWGNPYYEGPVAYGLDDTSKPALLGECPGNGSSGHTLTQDYESGYQYGWQGAMAWTSNGVDTNGNLSTLTPATNAFKSNHYSLVFPGLPTPTPTPTPLPTATPTPATITIFGDSWATGWSNASVNTTVKTVANPRMTGTKSCSAQYTAGYAVLTYSKSAAQSTAGYTAVKFWVNGGTGSNKSCQFYTQTADSGGESTHVAFTATVNTWTEITVPLSSLGNPATIKRINFYNNSATAQPAIYFDDIRLVP